MENIENFFYGIYYFFTDKEYTKIETTWGKDITKLIKKISKNALIGQQDEKIIQKFKQELKQKKYQGLIKKLNAYLLPFDTRLNLND